MDSTEIDAMALAAAAADGGSPASFCPLPAPEDVPLLVAVLEMRVSALEGRISLLEHRL
jgi:hypothetical protein